MASPETIGAALCLALGLYKAFGAEYLEIRDAGLLSRQATLFEEQMRALERDTGPQIEQARLTFQMIGETRRLRAAVDRVGGAIYVAMALALYFGQ